MGIPVAWIDTAGRVPKIQRRKGIFEIQYAANFRIERDMGGTRSDSRAGRTRLMKHFEKFGYHRALKLAGAKPGDRVKAGTLDVELCDFPEPTHPASCDGIRDYPCIGIPTAVTRLPQTRLRELAQWAGPRVSRALRR